MFKKYSEIENSYNTKYIKKIKDNNLDNLCDWLVYEKIDGANFCFIYDNKNIQYARRTSILKEDENFFDYQKIINKYNNQIIQIFNNTKLFYPQLLSINVYGELYGGIYIGFHEPIKCINKNVFYSPDLNYIVFDLYIEITK